MSFWDLLIEYKAIFGTVLGSVATLVTTYLLRNLGKLQWDIKDWEFVMYSQDECGGMIRTLDLSDIQSTSFSFEIILYNSSDSQKSLKDISLEFNNSNNASIFIKLEDAQSKRYADCAFFRILDETTNVLNVSPKLMTRFRFKGCLSYKNLEHLGNSFNVTMHALNHKNKKYRVPIATVNLEII